MSAWESQIEPERARERQSESEWAGMSKSKTVTEWAGEGKRGQEAVLLRNVKIWYLLTRKCCSLALSWKVWTICVGIQPHSLPPSNQLHAQKYCAIPSTPIASQSSRAHLTIRIGGYNTITDNKTSLTIPRATIPHSHFNNNNFRPPFSFQNSLPRKALL